MKIVYCLPQIYHAGGIERIVITKANYFADVCGWEITIITTEQKGKASYYKLSPKISVIDLNLDYENLTKKALLHRIWGKYKLSNKHKKLVLKKLVLILYIKLRLLILYFSYHHLLSLILYINY